MLQINWNNRNNIDTLTNEAVYEVFWSFYLICVNQSKIYACLYDVKALACKEKHFIKLFEPLSEGLGLHTSTLPSIPFMFHLSGRETWAEQLWRGC